MAEPSDILEAAKAGDLETVGAMLRATPALANADGPYRRTLLHEAAERDDLSLAQLAIEAGADLERETEWGDTPLEWAALIGAARVAQCLLDHGAKRFDLVTAAGLGRLSDVRQFLALGDTGEHDRPRSRQADAAGSHGWARDSARLRGDPLGDAFVLACRNGHTEVAKSLHAAGAAIDAKGYFGATALHWAAIHGHTETVEWLLSHGADPNIHDARFDAAADSWAREGGHTTLAARLTQNP